MNITKKRDSGSVLVLILVAIALFAALSYAMMRDGTGGAATRTMTDAQARLYATEIISYGDSVRQAVQRLRIRGIPDTGIGFDNTIFMHLNGDFIQPSGHNSNCMEESCKIFSPQDGGISPSPIPAQAAGRYITVPATSAREGDWSARVMNMSAVGTEANDLVFVNEGVKLEVCLALNKMLDIENPDTLPPSLLIAANLVYNGQSFSPPMSSPMGNSPHTHGKRSYCYTYQNAHEHKFYNYITVLIAR